MASDRIVVLKQDQQLAEFFVDRPVTIGRNPENGIVLDDPLVSRMHAVVERTPAGVMLRDLGSGNGTFVEGRKVIELCLQSGQIFHIGAMQLRFEEGDELFIPPLAVPAKRDHQASVIIQQDATPEAIESASAESVFNTMFMEAPTDGDAQRRLAAVYKANQIIASEHDLEKVFACVMSQIMTLVPANNGVILLRDEETGNLEPVHEHTGAGEEAIRVSSSIIKRAYEDGEAMLVRDAAMDDRFDASRSIMLANITSALCAPLTCKEEKLGAIYVDTRGTPNAFAHEDLELLVALANSAAIAIKNAQYVDQLESDFQTTLKLLANAIEMRDHYTLGHTWRVTGYSMEIAREMGWDEEKVEEVQMGGVLHDVGKIGVEDAILRKPDRLDEDEYAKMKIHPERGAALMKDCKKLEALIPYCLYHHERFDGKGYPYGLVGEDIPIEGRVVAVADTFDAMTSNRPYRDGLDPEIAIAEIEKNKGSQFDPVTADAFISAYRKGNIHQYMQLKQETDTNGIVCPFCSTYIHISEDAKEDDLQECSVCHRSIRLEFKHDTFYGVLLTEADLIALRPKTPPNQIFNSGDTTLT